MIHTRLSWEDIKQHFTYSWWAYVLVAVLLIFVWNMSYHVTEYEPPADKKLQITYAGGFVSQTVLDYYEEKAMAEFPELEKITVDNVPLDFTGDGTDYSGYQKLQVLIAVGEGDVYLMNEELMHIYGDMGAFAPLDSLVEEGGALYGMFTEEEIAKGTYVAEDTDGLEHVYALPADRLNGLLNQGVDTSGMFVMVTSYTQNPVYAEKAFIWLCQQTQEEPPAWLADLPDGQDKETVSGDGLPQIG